MGGKRVGFEVSGDQVKAYGSMPYVGINPPKIGGHINRAQMTHLKCLC